MKNKLSILLVLGLCFAISFSGLCAGGDPETTLTVEKITVTRDKGGREKIAFFCNQSCVPELFSIEEESPRVVMDMKGVFLIRTKTRNVNTGGKLVKRVRSHLDKQTKILRVVLDMDPAKYFVVRPMQDPSGNIYTLMIHEATSLSEQKSKGNKSTKASHLSQEQRIYIYSSDEQREGMLHGTAPSPEEHKDEKATKDLQSVDQGRSQLNAGEFAAAADTFTQILAAHSQNSLSYRLRGNAYDNLGNQQQAVEDWTQAARLGDATLQSYLDFLQVKWRENSAPENIHSDPVGSAKMAKCLEVGKDDL